MSALDLAGSGLLPDHALASVGDRLGQPGSGSPERSLTARLAGGLEFEVLPGRGLDIGNTYLRGEPLSWFSPVRDARPLATPSGTAWLSRFTGGLLTTCGLHNIGSATDTQGLHGDYSHLPADELRWSTAVGDDGASVELCGTVESVALFGASLRVQRRIAASIGLDGTSTLTVSDMISNVGTQPAGLSMLYHLNLGAPLVVPGSTVTIDAARVGEAGPHPEVPTWSTLPEPADHVAEAVFEHEGVAVDSDGLARATVTDPSGRRSVTIDWTAATLPRLYQWVFPTRGRWALGIEPATAPLFGPDRDGEFAGAPVLAPGQSRSQRIGLTIAGW